MQYASSTYYRTKSKDVGEESAMFRGSGALLYMLKLASVAVRSGKVVGIVQRYNKGFTDKVLSSPKGFFLSAPALSAVRQPEAIFGAYVFDEVVGIWLETRAMDQVSFLSPFISTEGFLFTPEEYLELRDLLEGTRHQLVYRRGVTKALEDLHTGFFRHKSLEECQTTVTDALQRYRTRAEALRADYVRLINGYARQALFQARAELAEQTQELMRLDRHFSAVNPRDKRAKASGQHALRADWAAYRRRWYGEAAFSGEMPDEDIVAAEQTDLAVRRKELFRTVAAEHLALNHLTATKDSGVADQLLRLARQLEQLVEDIDESGLYQLPISGATATTAQKQVQLLDHLIQRLENTWVHLPELPDFYAWRKYWYSLPSRLRRLLAPMMRLPAEAWKSAFSSWYFDRCLERLDNAQVTEWSCAALAAHLQLADTNKRGANQEMGQYLLLTPGEEIPGEVELLIDLSGQGVPPAYTGKYLKKAPITTTAAIHYALSGSTDARLVFQQSFVPRQLPDWQVSSMSELPIAQEVMVRPEEAAAWMPLHEWSPKPVDFLTVFFPVTFSAAGEKSFLRAFEEVIYAAPSLRIVHDWSPRDITRALLSDGLNGRFLAAALLRAVEACTDEGDVQAFAAIGREVRLRCALPDPTIHPLAKQIASYLAERLPEYFFTLHQPWRDTFLPLVVLSPSGKKTVLLPQGRLPGCACYAQEAERQRELRMAGIACLEINALACWQNTEMEIDRLVAALSAESRS